MKIHESYQDSKSKPTIEVSNNAFKVTLPNRNFVSGKIPEKNEYKDPSESRKQQTVLRLLEGQESVSRKEIETALNVSQATVGLVIRDMVEQGSLIRVGSGRNVRYRKKVNNETGH